MIRSGKFIKCGVTLLFPIFNTRANVRFVVVGMYANVVKDPVICLMFSLVSNSSVGNSVS